MWCSEYTSLSPVGRCCHCRLPPFLWSVVSVSFSHTPKMCSFRKMQTGNTPNKQFNANKTTQCTSTQRSGCCLLESCYMYFLYFTGSLWICLLILWRSVWINTAQSIILLSWTPPSPAFSSRAAPGWEIQPEQLSGQRGRRDGHHRL